MISLELSGRWSYRASNLFLLCRSTLVVTVRRLVRGPQLPGWTWLFETTTHFLRAQIKTANRLPNPADGREYANATCFNTPVVAQVTIEPVAAPVKGHWYRAKSGEPTNTCLYLHGGGYCLYAQSHRTLIALVTLATRSRTFALDYRPAPEHPFPAQLEDALAAYRWLLADGTDPRKLIVMGDSAGGNLTLALLLSLRDSQLPLPALAVCLSPWVDVENSGESMVLHEESDWVDRQEAAQWAEWFCNGASARNPLISPLHADLTGLPPIYLQAGGAEILHDQIRAFADAAQRQGANIVLDVWPGMNHDFQAYGDMLRPSQEALERIGQRVDEAVT